MESNGETDSLLVEALKTVQNATYDALCNSFDTRTAVARIASLITEYNSIDQSMIATSRTADIARWITSMVNVFGLNSQPDADGTSIGWSGIDVPESAKPYVSTISQIRFELRTKTMSSQGISIQDIQDLEQTIPKTTKDDNVASAPYRKVLENLRTEIAGLQEAANLPKATLSLCDRIRDIDLWNTGVYLEDRDGEPALIRPVTRELRAARTEKEDRERQKLKAREEREKQATAKADKGRLSHLDMFRTNEYSAWDEEGVPTKDKQGADITKSREKKLRKEWTAQKKLHEAWVQVNAAPNMTSQGSDGS